MNRPVPEVDAGDERRGWRFALASYLLWGFSPLFWTLLSEIPSMQVTAFRVVFTLPIVVGLVVLWLPGSVGALFANRRMAGLHLAAALLLACNWVIFVFAISTDRVVDASLGYFINPLLSVLLGVMFLRERLRPPVIFAVALAAVGVGILTWEAATIPWIALTLAATFAVYGLLRKQSDLGAVEGLAIEVIWLLPLALGFLVVEALRRTLEVGEGIAPWALLLVGAVTAVPLMLFAAGARRIPLWTIGLLQYLAPTLQFVVGLLVFDETVTAGRLLGFVVIWIALAVFAVSSLQAARARG